MKNESRILLLVGGLLLLSCPSLAQRTRPAPASPPKNTPGPELWVSGYTSQSVHRFGSEQGELRNPISGIPGAQSTILGPDGLYYVVAEESDRVSRFSKHAFVDHFVWNDPAIPGDETGGLDAPTAAVFGPDGNLYVCSFSNSNVLRYDGQTGAYLDVFVASGANGLNGPDAGMTFGPDGHLYIPSFNSNDVYKFHGTSGVFIVRWVRQSEGNCRNPRMLLFFPNGKLWVSCWGSNRINEYDSNGVYVRRVASMTRPTGMAIGPHDGDLYVTSDQLNRVDRFDPQTGVVIETFVPAGPSGILGATFLTFVDRY